MYHIDSLQHEGHEDLTCIQLNKSHAKHGRNVALVKGLNANASKHELTSAVQHLISLSAVRFSRIVELNYIAHHEYGFPSIPLNFSLATILFRRSAYSVWIFGYHLKSIIVDGID